MYFSNVKLFLTQKIHISSKEVINQLNKVQTLLHTWYFPCFLNMCELWCALKQLGIIQIHIEDAL
jgi:hypothetical protein